MARSKHKKRLQKRAGTWTCLDVLGRLKDAELGAVVLFDVVEDHGAGGHVDAHGEGLSGKEELDPAPLETQWVTFEFGGPFS